jgi:hypothetical protein
MRERSIPQGARHRHQGLRALLLPAAAVLILGSASDRAPADGGSGEPEGDPIAWGRSAAPDSAADESRRWHRRAEEEEARLEKLSVRLAAPRPAAGSALNPLMSALLGGVAGGLVGWALGKRPVLAGARGGGDVSRARLEEQLRRSQEAALGALDELETMARSLKALAEPRPARRKPAPADPGTAAAPQGPGPQGPAPKQSAPLEAAAVPGRPWAAAEGDLARRLGVSEEWVRLGSHRGLNIPAPGAERKETEEGIPLRAGSTAAS